MKEIEKMQAGLEYCYDDEDISMMKLHAIENANIFNSLPEDDLDKQHEVLCEILGSVGERYGLQSDSALIMERTYTLETISQETST